jgi:DNA-binding MarR family transcriptional regulator
VTKGNISQHLERMEAAGWVARRQVGRTKYLDLTPAGRRLYRKAVPDQEARIDRLFAVLPEHDRGTLADLLRRLDRGIGLKLAELTRPMTT